MTAELRIGQDQTYTGDDWWDWSIWIEGSKQDLDLIETVEWILHPTFVDPVRLVHNRKQKFRLRTGGWGTFMIRAKLAMKNGDKLQLKHNLELHYPEGRPAPT